LLQPKQMLPRVLEDARLELAAMIEMEDKERNKEAVHIHMPI
jgi:hypothetical protein